MQYKKFVLCTSVVVLALAAACSKGSEAPVSPTSAQPNVTEAGPSGETLKATAPTPQSPINNAQPDQLSFTAGKASALFGTGTAASYTYEFQVRTTGGGLVCAAANVPGGEGSSVTWTPSGCNLDFDTSYTWRLRATYQGAQGPWSSDATFRSAVGGFLNNSGVYDPLINGKTVGEIVGSVTFIPNVGVRLNDFTSHIRYRLPQTITEGEFSMIVTGIAANTEGDKTKVMAMSEGDADLIVNDRRLTVEKRGDPSGIVAWRIITREDQKDTEGAEREHVAFDAGQIYLWTATWNGFFNVRINQGGAGGPEIYSKGKHYEGVYDPNPHHAFVGAPIGRSGVTAASVPGMIVRQVWISRNPRPANIGR